MDTLAFGYILPTTGRIRVFHPLETCAARRTIKTLPPACIADDRVFIFISSKADCQIHSQPAQK